MKFYIVSWLDCFLFGSEEDWKMNRHRGGVFDGVGCAGLDTVLDSRFIHVQPVLLLDRVGGSKERRKVGKEEVA